jgi:hypothetical protein
VKRLIQACALTAIAMMAYSSYSAASGNDYYRWVDDRGNPVHSDRPPPKGTPYEVVSTGSKLVRQVDPSEGAVPATTEPTVGNDFEQVNTAKPKIQKNPEQCKRAQENLETLNTKVRIQIRNDQGELRPLSEEEKDAQRKQATEAIAVHCD